MSNFGSYPEISLADARQSHEDARKLIANGVDPGCLLIFDAPAHYVICKGKGDV